MANATPPDRPGRRYSPVALAFLAAALGLGAAGLVADSRQDSLRTDERARVENRLHRLNGSLTAQLNRQQAMLTGLVAFAELHGSSARLRQDFDTYAAGLHANNALIRAIQIFPAQGAVLVFPTTGNEAVQQVTLQHLINDSRPNVRRDLQRTLATGKITLSDPYELQQGGLGVVARQAIMRESKLWGVAVIITNVRPLLESAGVTLLPDLDVVVRDARGSVFHGDAALLSRNPVVETLALSEGAWSIAAAPRAGWGAQDRHEIALYRLTGLLSALLMGGVAYLVARRVTALSSTVSAQNQKLGAHARDYRRLFEEAEDARARAEAAGAESRRLLALAEQSRRALLSVVEDQQAAERMLRLRGAALEAAANAILITDDTGVIDWANPAFSALSGWPREQVLGRNLRDFVKSDEHPPEFYRDMWTTILSGEVWRGEIVSRRKDGAARTEEMTITPVRDEAGKVRHFIAIKQDITDRKTMEAQFLQAQRMEAIGTLAGGIAHDLNNILAPIMMVTGVLHDKAADKEDKELLSLTQSGVKRGAEIIKQLLTFSRGQSGQRLALQPCHLIREITAIVRETFPREIELVMNVPDQLWMLVADPTQLHQVLLNLCVNARDAMPGGGKLTVSATNIALGAGDPALPASGKPGSYVRMTVSDTGHGIPPEIKHRIFDPFFTTKPLGKGTGLGLPTVLGIVGSYGGFVDVESTVNQGTVFKVYWPAMPDGTVAIAETPPAAVAATGKRTSILVVDDEQDIREATRLVLQPHFHRVLTAAHGADALAQYLEHRAEIGLVVTDLMMPVMDGVALIRALRVIEPKLTIIAATGLNDPVKGNDLETLGVAPVLPKPFDGPTLLAAVRQHLQ